MSPTAGPLQVLITRSNAPSHYVQRCGVHVGRSAGLPRECMCEEEWDGTGTGLRES